MIKYPAQIDDGISLPVVNTSTGLSPVVFNRLRDAIISVEAELGVKPSAVFGTVRERLDYIQGIISSSLVSLSGDLGGTQTSVKVIGINGKPIQDNDLKDGYVLSWDAFNQYWAPQYISVDNLAVPFAALLETAEPLLLELNDTLSTPAFTAEYTVTLNKLESVILTDDQGNPQKNVTSSPDSFSSDQSYTRGSFGDKVIITLNAINNKLITRTSSITFTWTQNVYWGVDVAILPSQVTGLSNKELTTSRSKRIAVTAGVGQYIYYGCRTAYGVPLFTVNEISGGFHLLGITTLNGESFSVYQSDQVNLGSTNVSIL